MATASAKGRICLLSGGHKRTSRGTGNYRLGADHPPSFGAIGCLSFHRQSQKNRIHKMAVAKAINQENTGVKISRVGEMGKCALWGRAVLKFCFFACRAKMEVFYGSMTLMRGINCIENIIRVHHRPLRMVDIFGQPRAMVWLLHSI